MIGPTRRSLLRRMLLAVAVIALPFAGRADAQETRGTIVGIVRDASGGVLPGMSVVTTNEDTNIANETTTNDRGSFEFPYLLPGTYMVVVQAPGFKKFTQTGLLLSVDNRSR